MQLSCPHITRYLVYASLYLYDLRSQWNTERPITEYVQIDSQMAYTTGWLDIVLGKSTSNTGLRVLNQESKKSTHQKGLGGMWYSIELLHAVE